MAMGAREVVRRLGGDEEELAKEAFCSDLRASFGTGDCGLYLVPFSCRTSNVGPEFSEEVNEVSVSLSSLLRLLPENIHGFW